MNTEEAIEKGYMLAITGIDHQLVDINDASVEDLRRAIIMIASDRDRWRDLAEYLCQNADSVVVPDWIASRFPDPLEFGSE